MVLLAPTADWTRSNASSPKASGGSESHPHPHPPSPQFPSCESRAVEIDNSRRKLWETKADSAGSASDTASVPKKPIAVVATGTPHHVYDQPSHVHSPSAISVDGGSDRENGGHVPHMICMPDPPSIIQNL